MLFKLSVRNIRKSIKDYAIYFFTLIISVAIFYLFSSIEDQDAFKKYIANDPIAGESLRSFLKGLSVFVAVLLGLLIVYANRFLMKRRKKEFAIYLMLGMSKQKISVILFFETLLIGLGSLVVGLFLGVGLSQFMSAFVANLFEADLNAYKFVVSYDIIARTILYFSIAYIVVMLFNGIIITKCKLITLMQSGKKSEIIKQKNPWLCIIVFIIAVSALSFAYWNVTKNTINLEEDELLFCIGLGAFSTLLIFWSVSGLVLRAVMSLKRVYFKGLNTFTFRQISSRINTVVISMTIICLTLFVTICALSSSFAIRGALNKDLRECCPADIELNVANPEKLKDRDDIKPILEMPQEILEESGASKYLSRTQTIKVYFESRYGYIHDYDRKNGIDTNGFVTYADLLGDFADDYKNQSMMNVEISNIDRATPRIVSLSDYNAIAKLFGNETVTMDNNEYFIVADEDNISDFLDKAASADTEICFQGNKLTPALDKHVDGTLELFDQHINCGVLVVDDSMLANEIPVYFDLFGYYNTSSKDEMREMNKQLTKLVRDWEKEHYPNSQYYDERVEIRSKIVISDDVIGTAAITTFIGLYLGLIFIIICAAVIALKQLSECTDSINRYEILRKLGAEEQSISRSLFIQTAVFFFLPLALAVIHSFFGLQLCKIIIETFSNFSIFSSILLTAGIIILIYGGYFLITFLCGRSIIRKRK